MAFDPNNQQSIPSPEDQIRSMRADLAGGAEPKLSIPSSGNPVFDADEPVFNPNTVNNMQAQRTVAQQPIPPAPTQAAPAAEVSVDDLIAKQKSKNTLIVIAGGVAGLVVLGIAAYFAVPLFTKTAGTPVVVTDDTPSQTAPVTPAEPTQPLPPTTPTTPSKPTMQSMFMGQPDKQAFATVPDAVTPESIRDAFLTSSSQTGSTEVLISKTSGLPLSFVEIIGAIAPSLKTQTEQIFTGAVTSYSFTDGDGVWPGYVAKLNDKATPDQIKAWFTALEKVNKSGFFLSNPGTFSAFKNGIIGTSYPDRYAPGTKTGASFSYLILPEKKVILISTSYSSIKEGVRLLGL